MIFRIALRVNGGRERKPDRPWCMARAARGTPGKTAGTECRAREDDAYRAARVRAKEWTTRGAWLRGTCGRAPGRPHRSRRLLRLVLLALGRHVLSRASSADGL